MSQKKIDYPSVIEKINAIAKKGFCVEIGQKGKQLCVEAAVAEALGEQPTLEAIKEGSDALTDKPSCVDDQLSDVKINLNDAFHSTTRRTRALLPLAIAQLGSNEVIADGTFFQAATIAVVKSLFAYELARGFTLTGKYDLFFGLSDYFYVDELSELLRYRLSNEKRDRALTVFAAIILLQLRQLGVPGAKHVKDAEYKRAELLVANFEKGKLPA